MSYQTLTKKQLINELAELRRQIEELKQQVRERDRTVNLLRDSEEKYRSIFNTVEDAILISDESGRFVDVNQAACESLGYGKEELLKLSNRDIDVDSRGYDEFLKVRNGWVEKTTFEVNQRRKDGSVLPVEIKGKFFEVRDRRFALAIARNLTERKEAEQKLSKAYDNVERLVKERTVELQEANDQLTQQAEQRKQAEEASRESEEQYRTISNSV